MPWILRRRRELRLLIVGRSISDLGSMITFVAIPVQTFQLTDSPLHVGLLAWSSGPMLGNARAGITEAFAGLRGSVVGGGLVGVVGTVALAAVLPRFLAYDSRHGATAHPDVIEAL